MSDRTPPPGDDTALRRRVLDLVGQLVAELRPGSAAAGINPDDSLERDLGLGSLEQVELLGRIEQATGVRVSDTVLGAVDTPAELVRAVLAAGPGAAETPRSRTAPAGRPGLGTAAAAPDTAETLVDVLERHAQATPDRPHVYLREDDGPERTLTYGWLWRRAAAVAGSLRARGIGQRDTVAIMLRTEAAFFPAFFGTLLAGAVPVPVYPPFRPDRIADYAARQGRILSNAGARLLITFAAVERLAGLLRGQVPTLSGVATLDDLAPEAPADGPLPHRPASWLTGDDPALIQYTSGSTGQPKGVLLTHVNLLANIRAIRDGLAIRPDDAAVSWLPLYHDMGLIGAWLGSLYTGIPVAILSPLAFLSRPARWLWAIHEHRATLSVAPNFAFDLCAAKVTPKEMEGLDLGSLRILLNGSEAILPRTLTRFAERFAPAGLRPDALRPVYGLAECSVGLAVTPRRHPPLVDRVAPGFRATGRAEPSAGPDALAFVSCGAALPRHELRVADENGAALGERLEGRVQFRGPSTMAGYYRNPDATRAVTTRDGWLDSGDLGYLAGGELFLTGRRKDIVIKAGRNIYPHEAEAVVDGVDGVRKGCVAAFGVPDSALGTERLVVVAETRTAEPARRERMRREILERVADALGVPPDTVVLARPGSVLKTSSGKVRRSGTRDAYRAGTLERGAGSLARQWVVMAWLAARGHCARIADLLLRSAYTLYMVGLPGRPGAPVVGPGAHEPPAGAGPAVAAPVRAAAGRGLAVPGHRERPRARARPRTGRLRGQPRELRGRRRGARHPPGRLPLRGQEPPRDLSDPEDRHPSRRLPADREDRAVAPNGGRRRGRGHPGRRRIDVRVPGGALRPGAGAAAVPPRRVPRRGRGGMPGGAGGPRRHAAHVPGGNPAAAARPHPRRGGAAAATSERGLERGGPASRRGAAGDSKGNGPGVGAVERRGLLEGWLGAQRSRRRRWAGEESP